MFLALGLVIAGVVLFGQTVPEQVERGIIAGHLQGYADVATLMSAEEALPREGEWSTGDTTALDTFVRDHLLGHDTVRIKIWAPDGTIVYSDERSLIGATFPQEQALAAAFAGNAIAERPDFSSEENRSEQTLPPVWEFYVPIPGADGEPVAVFEVYHLAATFQETRDSVKGFVAMSTLTGSVFVVAVISAIMVSQGKRALRQQRRAETMFGDLVRAQTEERERIVGALHDDIGQRLYRVHYGLQDLASMSGDGIGDRLESVDRLVLEADAALRAELKALRHGSPEELRLDTALHELVELTEAETPLSMTLDIDAEWAGEGPGRIALFRAAREAIVNVRKHSGAGEAHIVVRRRARRVVVSVEDDGVGTDEDEGVGLAVARERLELLGGGLKVNGTGGRGTRVTAWLPIEVYEGHE
jgi:signal transduction histidine kinase